MHSLVFAMLCSAAAANQYPYDYQGPPPQQQQQQQQYNPQGYNSVPPPQGSQGPPPGQYPPPPGQYPPQYGAPPGQQQQQPPPGFQRPPGQYPGALTPYRGQPPPQQEGGFFSKLKSSIFAAGSAIIDSNPAANAPPTPPQYRRPGNPPQYGGGPPASMGGGQGQYRQQQPPIPEEGHGLLGKIKNLFSADDKEPAAMSPPSQRRPGPPGYASGPQGYPKSPQQQQRPPSFPPQGQQYVPPPQYQQPPQHTPPPPHQQQPQQQQHQQSPQLGQHTGLYPQDPSLGRFPEPQIQDIQHHSSGAYAFPPPPPPEEPAVPEVPPEPQVFVLDDCIVMVLRPVEFYRKKAEISRGGPHNLQVFTNFEGSLTRFRTDDGAPAYSTAELLEESSALAPQAVSALRALAQELEGGQAEGSDEDSDAAFESYTTKCQSVIAREGGLHIANVSPAVRAMLPFMPLRDGWRECLETLTAKGVPTYIFSSGYGDVVAQAVIQSAGLEATGLPNNLRIISNFFRTAPDGTVRAFSQPVVHERNKVASTASQHMNMPLPQRPNAVVFGSHEQDLRLTEGLDVSTQISVGHLELTEGLLRSLPVALDSFDAVVIGDSSFRFAKSLIDDLLSLDGYGALPTTDGGGAGRTRGSSSLHYQNSIIDSIFQ